MTIYPLKHEHKLPPTRKLYHEDAYLRECEAEVLYAQDDLLVLDQTVAYAESGGQVADRCYVNDVAVVDVQKNPGMPIWIRPEENPFGVDVPMVQIDTVVVHRCERPVPFRVGQRVHLTLDWDYRYQNMRNHSASHFLYLAVREVYGRRGQPPATKGCYIHNKSSRFDYYGKIDPGPLSEVAALANEWIARGEPIQMVPDRRTNEVSYWRCGSLVVPCGGTHVRAATELSPIRVKRQSQGQRVDRLYAILEDMGF
jgi:alanyl-tRNA synthetase